MIKNYQDGGSETDQMTAFQDYRSSGMRKSNEPIHRQQSPTNSSIEYGSNHPTEKVYMQTAQTHDADVILIQNQDSGDEVSLAKDKHVSDFNNQIDQLDISDK